MKGTAAMPQSQTLAIEPLTRAGAFFMLLPVLLLGVGVGGWIWMIRAAVDDPSAAIEPDYYAQAAHIDEQKARLARSEALGWNANVETEWTEGGRGVLRVRLVDREGASLDGLEVVATAFPNIRANDRQELSLTSQGSGIYSAELHRARAGIWELRLGAKRAAEEFHSTIRFEMPRQAAARQLSEGTLP